MTNPLNDVPLNTKKSYCMATTHSGCEIFMPVDSDSPDAIMAKRNELQQYLNTQPMPAKPEPDPKQAA